MNKMYGRLRQDDHGHWYLVPETLLDKFSDAVVDIENEIDFEKKEVLIELFVSDFNQYYLYGELQDLKIEMEG